MSQSKLIFDTTQDSYTAFRNIAKERTSSIVPWIGSGLSQPAGLPTWASLKAFLCDKLENKATHLVPEDAGKLTQAHTLAIAEANPWIAFEILKNNLGSTSYRDAVREVLAPAETASFPSSYTNLWHLPLGGILNLNLDRLATRAFSEIRPGKALNEFYGKQAGESTHLLKSPHPFIANLHGISSHESSWVLTQTELRRLQKHPGYRDFITACLSTRTILFIGITADDVAAGGYLACLTTLGIDTGTHFWITSRRDLQTDQWAESTGIRIIRYPSSAGDHSALDGFFSDLIQFIPPESSPPPVRPTTIIETTEPLTTPEELLSKSAEDIRIVLNRQASHILAQPTPAAYEEYNEFCRKYDQAIYRAWYVTTEEPANQLLGYTLISEIARGAFGRVFHGVDKSGNDVAIKLLHEEVRRRPEMLQSFRRGVRSMHILSQRKVEGMVPYHHAFEIPALAVMELIEGPDLREAVTEGRVTDWPTILRIAVDLARTIRQAHQLPERVLHRDIRPSNIMLRGYHGLPSKWDVVVLDFDLSWHRGALEVSVSNQGAASGFLAPEQVIRIKDSSTRNAAVDSFGLAMTLYFLRTNLEPIFAQHKHNSWESDVITTICKYACRKWRSLPRRFARIIIASTRDKQSERWDMAQIHGELQRLRDAEAKPDTVESAELLAEELAAKAEFADDYHWDAESFASVLRCPSGAQVSIKGLETDAKVQIELSWTKTGKEDFRRVKKWIPKVCDQAKAALSKAGAKTHQQKSADRFVVTGVFAITSIRGQLEKTANVIGEITKKLQFQ